MVIAQNPSYIDAPTFTGQVSGGLASNLLANISPIVLQDILNRASGRADAIMCRSLLAREETRYYMGTGTQSLDIDETPLLYVRQIAFAQPGLGGLIIPTQNILVDYESGELITFTPLLLQGAGYVARFPRGVELAVRVAWGYGYAVAPPQWTASDTQPSGYGSLAPGQYSVAVTAATFWGESTATPQTITTATGAFALAVKAQMGSERYRVYIGPQGTPAAQLGLVGEIPATSFTSGALGITISSLLPPIGMFAATLPQSDTTGQPTPPAVVEATRLLALDMLYEDANPANIGIARNGDKQFRRGEDSAAKIAGSFARAESLLAPFRYIDVI